MTPAETLVRQRRAQAKKVRQFVTPEGVDLELKIASSGLRLGGLIVDMMLIVGALIVCTLLVIWLGMASRADIRVTIRVIGGLLPRNVRFIGFALRPRAATPRQHRASVRPVGRENGGGGGGS